MVSGSVDGTLTLRDTETHTQVGDPFKGRTSEVHCVSFTPMDAVLSRDHGTELFGYGLLTRMNKSEHFRGIRRESTACPRALMDATSCL